MPNQNIDINKEYAEKYGFNVDVKAFNQAEPGLSEKTVKYISDLKGEKGEHEWIHNFRMKSLNHFLQRPMPTWGGKLSDINFDDIIYYSNPVENKDGNNWDELPENVKKTFDKLGIPEAEKKMLAGVGAQFDSEVVYHKVRQDLEDQGVIFVDPDTGLQKYPKIFKEWFGQVVPPFDNKFAALNSAVYSGGCLVGDTKVFTSNPGIKDIRDIEKGDFVFSLNNKGKFEKSQVLGKIYSGRKNVFEILAGGRTIQATSNHMFLTIEKSRVKLNNKGKLYNFVWKPLKKLKKGDVIAISKKIPDVGKPYKLPDPEAYTKNKKLMKMRYPSETSDNLMWILGLLVGDGNIYFPNKNMCFINFAIPRNDPVRKKSIEIINKIFSYKVVTENQFSFTINSKSFGKWLNRIGFIGNAKNKKIPRWVYGLPISQRLSFIGGLIDSDGYVEVKNNIAMVSIELSNLDLITDIKLLAFSCGLFSGGKIVKRKRMIYIKGRKFAGKSYRCRITGNLASIDFKNETILKKISEFKNNVRKDRYNTIFGRNFSSLSNSYFGFAKIKYKELVGKRKVYDIQVKENPNFVANGIITHNSFIYIPKGVHVEQPLQAYFRINSNSFGQFERTLIIADEGSRASYVEGCSAPIYTKDSLHAAVVEIVALPGSHIRYTTLQNWSKNVYNLVTKRAYAFENSIVEWIDANIGSKLTMKYPSVFLKGRGAKADILSVAFAGKDQHQDTGAKAVHLASDTTSRITAKSVSKDGGRTSYRGLLHVAKKAENVKSSIRCDALLLDEISKTDTYPYNEIQNDTAVTTHEASVGKIGEEQLFYLMSRGLNETEALNMIVTGFFDAFAKEIPLEYAVEFNRLIQLEMAGSVG